MSLYLTQVILDTQKHETARALYNREIMHAALERCFSGDRQHPLWRIDRVAGRNVLLFISKDIPDLSVFCPKFALANTPARTKAFDPASAQGIAQNAVLKFRITCNPTVKKNKTRVPLNINRTPNQSYCAMDWLIDRLAANGAELLQGDVVDHKVHDIRGKNKHATLAATTFEGYLRITDRDKFVEALTQGIGHGKAYGCGMLSVMR